MVFGNGNLNKKGQLSVEFILIILVVLILIQTIILPLRDYSEGSMKDITTTSYLEQDTSKILAAINDLNYYSVGKIIVDLHVPKDSNFYIYEYTPAREDTIHHIAYTLKTKSNDLNNVNGCTKNICTKIEALPKEVNIDQKKSFSVKSVACKQYTSECYIEVKKVNGLLFKGPNDYKLGIVKDSTGITISKVEK